MIALRSALFNLFSFVSDMPFLLTAVPAAGIE